jgi:hypothetical protein
MGVVERSAVVSREIELLCAGQGTLAVTIQSDSAWLSVDKSALNMNGGETATVTVTVNGAELEPAISDYTGILTITPGIGAPKILTVNLTATCVLVKPNPASLSRTTPGAGRLVTFFGSGIVPGGTAIMIYTLSGEPVKSLSAVDRGLSTVDWNGLDESGSPVSPGIYLYVYQSSRERGIGKFTIVR